MTKKELKKYKEWYLDKGGYFDLNKFGKYTQGLSNEEIIIYLAVRGNTVYTKQLLKKFYKIAGCNTVGMYICNKCGDNFGLTYRHDVLRFSDVLFGKTKDTYFD